MQASTLARACDDWLFFSLVLAMGCDVDGDIRLDFVEDGRTVDKTCQERIIV